VDAPAPAPLVIVSASYPGDAASAATRDPVRLGAILDLLVDNPWSPIDRMTTTVSSGEVARGPYARARVVAALAQPRGGQVELAAAGGGIEARLTSFSGLDAQLYVEASRVGPDGANHARELLARMMPHLPDGSAGGVYVDALMDPDDRARALPEPFFGCPWLAAVTPGAAAASYDRAALLATPAEWIREDPNGTIWLQTYRALLEPDAPDARARQAAVRAHLVGAQLGASK
jgi:hypothetical protein